MIKEPNSRFLLTGVTGFLGQAIAKRLVADPNIELLASARRYTEGMKGVEVIQVGDLGEATDWEKALNGVDVVIHTAARAHILKDSASDPLSEYRKINVEGTLKLAFQAAAAGVKRFIFISSIKVNGESTTAEQPFTVDDMPQPADPYGVSKYESELGLQKIAEKTAMEVVIIRPPLIYGPGVKANFRHMMLWVDRGWPLPLGAIRNSRSLIAIDNLVDLIVTCIEHPAAANEVFLASDGFDQSTTEVLQKIAKALGKSNRLIPVPATLLTMVAKLLGKEAVVRRLCGSLKVDISKTRSLLGWSPPISLEEGLRRAAEGLNQ